MKKTLAVFFKDWQAELKSRVSINTLLMFILTSVTIIAFLTKSIKINSIELSAFYWIVMFFSSMSGLARCFVSEEEKGTAITLKLLAAGEQIFIGKLIFNILVASFINISVTLLFFIFFESFTFQNYLLFFISLLLGNTGIAIGSTVVAAIIAKASNKSNLFTVLSFPILLPIIIVLMKLTEFAIDGVSIADAFIELGFLICYIVIIFTAGLMLFNFIWDE